MLHLLFFYELQ